MSLMKNKEGVKSNIGKVPWYFGRRFWGILIGLSVLPGILTFWDFYKAPFFTKIITFLQYLASGFNIMILDRVLKINIPSKWGIYYIILYYIILVLLFYLTFREKRAKIIFSILIIITILVSTIGLGGIIAFSS